MISGSTDHAAVARNWFKGYFQDKLCEMDSSGHYKKVAVYEDVDVGFKWGFDSPWGNGTPLGGVFPAWYLIPLSPEIGEKLFLSSVRGAMLELGTNTLAGRLLGVVGDRWAAVLGIGFSMPFIPPVRVKQLALASTACLMGVAKFGSKRAAAKVFAALALMSSSLAGLVCAGQGLGSMYMLIGQMFMNGAIELGLDDLGGRFRELFEIIANPKEFGDGNFGFFYKLENKYPRGQLSAQVMLAEINEGGAWRRFFENRNYRDRFTAPTVEGVDFPTVGLSQAWNDPKEGTLTITTYASTPSKAGSATSFRLVNLLPAEREDVAVTRDGECYGDWTLSEDGTRLDLCASVAAHTYVVRTGYTGPTGVDTSVGDPTRVGTSVSDPTFRSRL